jgi:hypothetical protein
MRVEAVVILMLGLLVAGLVSAEPRERGRGESARHPERDEERMLRQPKPLPGRGVTRAERVDPAVRHFWSDRCVRQRRFGLPHTGDCDHPAYSGGGYGGVYDYRGRRPYSPYRPRAFYDYPRGGSIHIERDRRRFEWRPTAPSHVRGGSYGRRGDSW